MQTAAAQQVLAESLGRTRPKTVGPRPFAWLLSCELLRIYCKRVTITRVAARNYVARDRVLGNSSALVAVQIAS